MGKVRRGGFVFLWWKGDHPPRHVHVYHGDVIGAALRTRGTHRSESGAAVFRDIGWIEESNILVAEVSTPSTGVGYEIATARYRYHMPVICLWRPAYSKRCSAMVAGDLGVELIEYEDGEAGFASMLERLREALGRARE